MWIFGQKGVLSIVRHETKRGTLLVRAIEADDITSYWPKAKIAHTPKGDYHFRTELREDHVAAQIAKEIVSIDYDKVKPAIADDTKDELHLAVFFSMMDYQEAALEK